MGNSPLASVPVSRKTRPVMCRGDRRAIPDMPDTSENALSRTCPIESPHRAEVGAARGGGFSGRVPRAVAIHAGRAPHTTVASSDSQKRSAIAAMPPFPRQTTPAFAEVASACAGLPPRSPWTTRERLAQRPSDARFAMTSRRVGRAFSSTVCGRRACRSSRGPCGDAGNNPCRRQGDQVVAPSSTGRRLLLRDDHWRSGRTPISSSRIAWGRASESEPQSRAPAERPLERWRAIKRATATPVGPSPCATTGSACPRTAPSSRCSSVAAASTRQRNRPRHLPADRRGPRRAHLGGACARRRQHLSLHAPGLTPDDRR
jgi:hypothetical protein